MRRIPPSSLSSYGPAVKLFLDDVEEMIEAFTASCKSVTLNDDDHAFDSLADLIANKGTRPKKLEINGHEPWVTLRITERRVHLHVGDPEKSASLVYQIRRVLARRALPLSSVKVPRWTVFIAVAAMYVILALGFLLPLPKSPYTFWLLLLVAISPLVLLIVYDERSDGAGSTLHLARAYEATTYWSRNRDLLIAVVSAVLGAVIASVVTWWLQNRH